MSFFTDTSFFVLLALIMCGAAWLGLRERPLKRYGLAASLVMLFCLFCKTPLEGALAATYLATQIIAAQWLWRAPKSRARFGICLALAIAPLAACKAGQAAGTGLLGFVGISYLTFRSVQILIETRDGLIERMSPADQLYFLAFFPTFTSGPIDRSRRFQKDLDEVPSRDEYAGMLARGILLIMCGMVYNMVFAAVIRTWWNPVAWSAGGATFGARLWTQVETAYAYGLYLFFDFAGYSMMAMGASYALGIRCPRNFRAPFLATSLTDFWNRWHITLSTWLRDFVFMRVARSLMRHRAFKGRKARLRTSQAAVICNMVLMGFWHGLSADYILYGLYHGLLLAAEQGWEKTRFYKAHRHQTWYRLCSWFVTMQLVFLGFALFSGQISMLVKGA